tara:strand:+ start:4993 stop:5445 length:453 start_codon:yes stop_codon:yes gene_type:complete
MAKHIKCSTCGKKKWMRYDTFKVNLLKFHAENRIHLNTLYKCGSCSKLIRATETKEITRTPEFIRFKRDVQEIIDDFIKRNWRLPQSQEWCRGNIEALFKRHHINSDEFKVLRNGHVITGFVILNLPFWDSILVEVNWKETKQNEWNTNG